MKIYNAYILTVAALLLLTTVILTAVGQTTIGVYYTIFLMEALIVTELFIHFSSKAGRGLSLVSTILFAGFVVMLSFQILWILQTMP